MEKKELILIREYRPADEAFVYKTWLEGLYCGNSCFRTIRKGPWIKAYREQIRTILARDSAQVKVAALIEDEDVILGYAVLDKFQETGILHWVWVKPVWRELGIAKDLVPSTVKVTTHITTMARNLKPDDMIYNPFVR